jgi:serine protease Do
MRRRTTMKLGLAITLVAAAAALATAEPRPALVGWPDQHPSSYLGVHIDELTQQTASSLKLSDTSGALITYLDQDGPACKAGLKINDVVVGFNGSKVQSPEQLQEMLHATPAGKTVAFSVVRDGRKKDISVTLGAWPDAMAHAHSLPPGSAMAFAPPNINIPDIDVPSFTTLSSHHGIVVESMCPQLADYFGVPHGQGVLVRSVEKGSPAEAAGLKAGDVIVKVNNETVHDMADWRRAMHGRGGKIPVAIVRDKHEQAIVISLPGSADTSELEDVEWGDLPAMLATIKPSEQQLDQMRQDIQRSMKLSQKDIEKMQKEIQKSLPSQKDLQKQIEKSMKLKQKDIEKMQRDVQAYAPKQEQLDQMRREIDESLKNWTPQLQQQMEQFKKQMEEQKLNLQEMLKGFEDQHEF